MTACEMRIIDWSSDVCSSDLYGHARPEPPGERTGSGVEATAPEAVGGLSADRPERLFGALEAPEMAQAEHPLDVPRNIDDAGSDVEIGRASRRERVCQDVKISVVAVSLKHKTQHRKQT